MIGWNGEDLVLQYLAAGRDPYDLDTELGVLNGWSTATNGVNQDRLDGNRPVKLPPSLHSLAELRLGRIDVTLQTPFARSSRSQKQASRQGQGRDRSKQIRAEIEPRRTSFSCHR